MTFLSNGHEFPVASGGFGNDMPDPEWLYFSDGALDRSLAFAHHEADTLPETYFRMGSGSEGMTVWGNGRAGNGTRLTGTHHLTIMLIDSREAATIRAAVTSAVADR